MRCWKSQGVGGSDRSWIQEYLLHLGKELKTANSLGENMLWFTKTSYGIPLTTAGWWLCLEHPLHIASSVSTGSMPFNLNACVLTDKRQLFCIHAHKLPPTCFSSLFLYGAQCFLDKGRCRKCFKYSILAKCHFWSLRLHEQFGWKTQLGIPVDVKMCTSGLGFCFVCWDVNSWEPLWN